MEFTRIVTKFFCILFSVRLSESNDLNQQTDGYNCNEEGSDRYFIGSLQKLDWASANEICRSRNASLPIIHNEYEQNAFKKYLKCRQAYESKIQSIWMSGKKETLKQWTWINDQILNNEKKISQDSEVNTYAMLRPGPNFTAERPSYAAWYLCQYSDDHMHCRDERSVNLTNSCLIRSPNTYWHTTWYEARNECRARGGDLVFLTDQDPQILKNHTFPNRNSWIGLRKVKWVWMMDIGNRDEVIYTKWSSAELHRDSGDLCISASASDGKWKPLSCNHSLSVVCDKHALMVGLVLGFGMIVPLLAVTTILIVVVVNQREKLKKMSANRNDNATTEAQCLELQEGNNATIEAQYEELEDNNTTEAQYEEPQDDDNTTETQYLELQDDDNTSTIQAHFQSLLQEIQTNANASDNYTAL